MCKVLMFTEFKNIEDIETVVNIIHKYITKSDDDGFGYSFTSKDGVFGERTTNPTWKYNTKSLPFANMSSSCNKFGIVPNSEYMFEGPALFHGRTSTNHATLVNTHPILKQGWSLVHNGVVTNHGPKYEMSTTNDSEHTLHHLMTNGITGLETHLTGYYAIGAIDPNGMLHVIRDSIAGLYCVWSPDLESYVFGTTIDLITSVLDEIEVNYDTILEFNKNTYVKFKGNTIVDQVSFNPRGYDNREKDLMSKSLHYLNDDWNRAKSDYFRETSFPTSMYTLNELKERNPEEAFFQECEYVDAAYSIQDWNGRKMTVEEFKQLDRIGKASCYVVRPDGTLMDIDNYYEEKLG